MKNRLTQKRLKEVLDYNSLTGVFVWKVRTTNSVKVGDIAGSKSNGYREIRIDGKDYKAHRLAWFYVHGYFPENQIDHIDRIRNHNWISNLREVSQQCNLRNCGNPKDNTSGCKGVCWHKQENKWQAQIRVNNKAKYLGRYSDFAEAVCHRLAGEQCLDWSSCDSSSPAFQYVRNNIQV